MIPLVILVIAVIQDFFGYKAYAIAIDNGVEGEPTISCGANEITFTVSTKRPFEGKIFVKGEYGRPECTTTGNGANGASIPGEDTNAGSNPFTQPSQFTGVGCPPCPVCADSVQNDQQPTSSFRRVSALSVGSLAQLVVHIGTCNMKRERRLNPTGVTLTLAVVVSFHPQFITKVDKAYQLRCFYMEAEKTVTSVVDVSMPQTTEIVAQVPMPICSYTIRRGSPDGPEIQYARVGDVVYHRWQCTSANPAIFGMLVHSCYVEDGRGQRVEVINQTGCSLDTYVINDLNYDTSLFAYVQAHVFKFADQTALDFQCAINICVKEGDGCSGITPPTCGRKRLKRSTRSNRTTDDPMFEGTPERISDWDLHARRLTVVDIDNDMLAEDLARLEKERDNDHSRLRSASWTSKQEDIYQKSESSSTYCLSITAFGVLVSSCTFVLTISTALLTMLYILKHTQQVLL